ncbi:retrotransposon protein [Cucumis melo var. makuwa]|uniref:Retrotransposon protein n=1 Tax=Cucumis melo var. makuwa TaxID=1194695 RepID=A0A5D3DHZ9_CUCMM|nr:retrotransposon protein [Cucumis melo var. makuwa]TYK23078.1 retrotransposon protein [Cucumis melo var. makuwa]
MTNCDDNNDVDERDSTFVRTTTAEDIQYIETIKEWSQWCGELAEQCSQNDSCSGNLIPCPKHVWTKKEEDTLVECLMELMSAGRWNSDNGIFRLGYLAQLENVRASRPSRTSKGRARLSGSKRNRGSQEEGELEVIHMALECTNDQLKTIAV